MFPLFKRGGGAINLVINDQSLMRQFLSNRYILLNRTEGRRGVNHLSGYRDLALVSVSGRCPGISIQGTFYVPEFCPRHNIVLSLVVREKLACLNTSYWLGLVLESKF